MDARRINRIAKAAERAAKRALVNQRSKRREPFRPIPMNERFWRDLEMMQLRCRSLKDHGHVPA